MQMLYNSDSFAVVRIDVPGGPAVAADAALAGPPGDARGGYEIVDKTAQREIFIGGALAERFRRGAQALIESGPVSEEAFDDYIAGFTGLAQQPLVYH